MSSAIRDRWVEVESAFEDLADLDPEARLTHLAAIALNDIELANAVGELLAADTVERSALDLDAALLVAVVDDGSTGAAPRAEAAAPRIIGRYKILRRVGRGSSGEVFEAESKGRRVAVKRLLPGFAGTEIERRFEREREILTGLDHPAIARLLDAGTDRSGRAFLVLEWVEGRDIVSFATERALPELERLRLFLRLCEAVEFAHRHRVLHRDLKPSNILVTESGWPKLLDFGIARLLDAEGTGRETASGVWLFTVLRALDQLDLMIGLSYVTLLTVVGAIMIYESVRAEIRTRKGMPATLRRPGSHTWLHGLPFKLRFKRSKIYVSAIPVWAIGFIIGFVGAIMGIGGGFLLVPMLIYFLRVPTATVIGTSMVLTLVTMASATVMHAATNHLVDAVLALILMVGGAIGAQFGARTGARMRGERLRLLLGLLVFAVGLRFAYELVVQPDDLFSLRHVRSE